MRIALYSDHFYPELGGIQDSTALLAKGFGERGHDVDVVVPRYAAADYAAIGAGGGELPLGARVRIHRRASVPFPSSTKQSRACLPAVVRGGYHALRHRPDVIHAHSPYGLGVEALVLARALRVPLIVTDHTAIQAFAPYMPIPVAWAVWWYRFYHNRCDLMAAPSQSVFDELGVGRLKPPCRVMSNPIDTQLFRAPTAGERAATRNELGFTGPVVTFAGRLGPEKNLEPLVQAVAQLRATHPHVTLALAGHGSHETALRALAGRTGCDARFLGTLDAAALARLLGASDVFAMPSTSETQSMAMLQAMACGLRVVAANSRALPEYVLAGDGALVDPGDVAGFAQALDAVIRDPARVCLAGRQFVEQFSIGTVIAEWEDVYRSAIEGHIQYGREHQSQLRRSGVQ